MLPTFAELPKDNVVHSTEWHLQHYKNLALVALGTAINLKKHTDPAVLCRLTPRKGVFAIKKFNKGELCLVPAAFTIKAKKTTSTIENPAVFTVFGDVPLGYVFELGAVGGNDVVSPTWFVQPTSEKKDANMKITVMKVEVVSNSVALKTPLNVKVFDIPFFENLRAIKGGTELLYFR